MFEVPGTESGQTSNAVQECLATAERDECIGKCSLNHMAIRVINIHEASAANCGRALDSVLIAPLLEGAGWDGALSDAVETKVRMWRWM